ncbi:MAG: T9SS type A sorting domain-containing protein [Bacteroidales bacterium]|nr:T9SS type A sorting domain-containing protein [Bacteroidales bacterium]
MKRTRLILPVMGLLCLVFKLSAQDVVYTISGEYEGNNIALDSILFENLKNGTSLVFDNLPVQNDYIINLTKQEHQGSTGINLYAPADKNICVVKNVPGQIHLKCNYSTGGDARVTVYNLQGQLAYESSLHAIQSGSVISVSLAKSGIYIVKVAASSGSYTFRTVGSSRVIAFKINLDDQPAPVESGYKSALISAASDFSFNIGDSLRVSVFKDRLYASPQIVVVSNSSSIEFLFESITFIDPRDDNEYNWVKIGEQTWMAENLAYLPSVSPSSGNSYTDPYYYVYGYQGTDVTEAKATTNYQTYGVLYNWPATKNACPAGWHLPSDAEWTELENYLIANGYNYDGTTTDNKIAKAMATDYGWNFSSNTGAAGNIDYPAKRNATGFSALPGGYRHDFGGFDSIGTHGTWWSATEGETNQYWYRRMGYDYSYVHRNMYLKEYGYSVRCLRD